MIIKEYQQIFYPVYLVKNNNFLLRIAIRSYYQNNERYYVVVDPNTVFSEIVLAKDVKDRKPSIDPGKPNYFSWAEMRYTPYVSALYEFTETPATNAKNGLSHALTKADGFFLTVDMCPSVNPFEQAFFDKLVSLKKARGSAFPVSVCMSGRWLETHADRYSWLQQQIKEDNLNINWVNHSYSHLYFKDVPVQENFLLPNFENIPFQILEVEKMQIEAGQTPSPFMRLPGLVGSSRIYDALRNYGLIPLGADAWLAKGEKPVQGSIVLVHGNGNEHAGIELVMKLLDSTPPNKWLPLQHSLSL